MCFGVVWFELQRPTELRLAVLHSAQARERVAEIVVGQRVATAPARSPACNWCQASSRRPTAKSANPMLQWKSAVRSFNAMALLIRSSASSLRPR